MSNVIKFPGKRKEVSGGLLDPIAYAAYAIGQAKAAYERFVFGAWRLEAMAISARQQAEAAAHAEIAAQQRRDAIRLL